MSSTGKSLMSVPAILSDRPQRACALIGVVLGVPAQSLSNLAPVGQPQDHTVRQPHLQGRPLPALPPMSAAPAVRGR